MAWNLLQSNQGTANADLTLALSTPAVGDLLIGIQHRGNGLPTTPTGYTLIDRGQFGTSVHYYGWYYRIADGTETGVTFLAGANTNQGEIFEYSGNAAAPLDQHSSTTSSNSASKATNAITPTKDGALIFAWLAGEGPSMPVTAVSNGFARIGTDTLNTSAANLSPQVTAAAISTTFTLSSATAVIASIGSFLPAPVTRIPQLMVASQAVARASTV